VRAHFPKLQIKELRGNVNTRLGKLDAGEYDAIILASAGLIRLEMGHRITDKINSTLSLPAGGQGAVGIECRSDDLDIQALLAPLHHKDSASCVLAERAVNRHLQGGCQVPIACFAELDASGTSLALRGLVGSIDGTQILRADIQGHRDNAEQLGVQLAEQLLAAGAGEILAEVYGS
jgi:hydroxymethylbilane synthase